MEADLTGNGLVVVVAEDDSFTRSLVGDGLRAEGFEVRTAADPDAAWELLAAGDVHALVCDLDFGDGVSGAPLLRRVAVEQPWLALVVLTSHISPELAVSDADALPGDLVYLVKSRLRQVGDITAAVHEALTGRRAGGDPEPATDHETVAITPAQAEMLRMLASGMTTRAIAEHRGTSVRAAETMIARLYTALGLQDDTSTPRVAALRLWQQGRVRVR